MMTDWIRRMRARLRRGRLDAELAEEMQHHLDLRRQRLIDDGMDPGRAAMESKRLFGNATVIREQTRDQWSVRWLDSLVQDVRYGSRLLRRSPGFTALAVASLAVGIGAAAAVFNVADAALFRPLPVSAPHELRQFRATLSLGAGSKVLGGVDLTVLRDMQRAADFATIVGFRTVDDVTIGGGSDVRRVRAELGSANYFDALGVPARAGRMLMPLDDRDPPAIVISERLWHDAFAGDPALVGRTVQLNGTPIVVAGVAKTFRGLVADRPADVFAPLSSAALVDPARASASVQLVFRVSEGTSIPVAEERAKALFLGVGPSMLRGGELRVELLPATLGVSDARDSLQQPLWLGLIFAGVLLFAACANTGGLLLARFTSRRGEFAVRLAIGAGRSRLVGQLVVEAVLLACLAAAAGLIVASLAAPVLLRSIPIGSVALDFDLRFDWRLIAFTAAAAVAAALFAACASLWRLLRADPSTMLVGETRSVVPGRRRLTHALIAAQVACSLLLLVGAGSMTRSLINLHAVNPGFETARTFMLTADTVGRVQGAAALASYFGRLQERLASAPYVGSVSLLQFPLMSGAATTGTVAVAGFAPVVDDDRWVRMFFVGPRFFETAGMHILLGRDIGPQDAARSERVAVVNQEFARFYFGRPELALGRHVNENVRIVGVAADASYSTLRDRPVRGMFIPYAQAPSRPAMTFVVRPSGDPQLAMTSVAEAARVFDPQLRLKMTTIGDQVTSTLSRERFVAALAAALSGLALFLSCLGLYGAVSYAVSARRNELAIRLALGATRRDIVRLMLGDPLRTAAVGIAAGVPAVYGVMRGVSSLLFGVSPFDMWTLLACSAGLLTLVCAAAFFPARRACTVHPLDCLRYR